MASSIYDFTVKDQQGNDVSLADYRGRVLLVVNTATECGFTPTYAQLQELYTALHERGLDILDFPCDQFGHQAPGTNEEIAQFCTSRFGVTFRNSRKSRSTAREPTRCSPTCSSRRASRASTTATS